MTARRNGLLFDCVVVDLNTQRDFCTVDGVDPVANVRSLIPALRNVVAWAKWNRTPVISSVESHRACEFADLDHPGCCVDGSNGQCKIDFTILDAHTQVEVDNTLSCPLDLFKKYQQVIFRKRADDLLSNPKADRFLNQLSAADFILCGIGLESSVKALALALLARERNVTVVLDACGYWNKGTADLATRQMVAKGARLISVSGLLARRLERRVRIHIGCRINGVAGNGWSGKNGRNGKNHKTLNGKSTRPTPKPDEPLPGPQGEKKP